MYTQSRKHREFLGASDKHREHIQTPVNSALRNLAYIMSRTLKTTKVFVFLTKPFQNHNTLNKPILQRQRPSFS
jgi:hypothetical protein